MQPYANAMWWVNEKKSLPLTLLFTFFPLEFFLCCDLSTQQLWLCSWRLVSANEISSASRTTLAPLNVWVTKFPICHVHLPQGIGVSYVTWWCDWSANMLLSIQFKMGVCAQCSRLGVSLGNIMAAWTTEVLFSIQFKGNDYIYLNKISPPRPNKKIKCKTRFRNCTRLYLCMKIFLSVTNDGCNGEEHGVPPLIEML